MTNTPETPRQTTPDGGTEPLQPIGPAAATDHPTASHPASHADAPYEPAYAAPGDRTSWRHRVLGMKGVAAVALASLVLGGAGGAALGALSDGGNGDAGGRFGGPGRFGQLQPGQPGQQGQQGLPGQQGGPGQPGGQLPPALDPDGEGDHT
ncbi:MAG: hypothetical protein ACXVEJ_06910 [Nocardioides sp.]